MSEDWILIIFGIVLMVLAVKNPYPPSKIRLAGFGLIMIGQSLGNWMW